jgi:hypothetical protein
VPAPLNAPLSPFFSLDNGYTVRITALDPATGAEVSGVIASEVSIAVDQSDAPPAGSAVPLSGAVLPGGV